MKADREHVLSLPEKKQYILTTFKTYFPSCHFFHLGRQDSGVTISNVTLNRTIENTVPRLLTENKPEFTRARTKEVLGVPKSECSVLGRPKVTAKSLRLDALAEMIDMYLEKRTYKRLIAKLLDLSPNAA